MPERTMSSRKCLKKYDGKAVAISWQATGSDGKTHWRQQDGVIIVHEDNLQFDHGPFYMFDELRSLHVEEMRITDA